MTVEWLGGTDEELPGSRRPPKRRRQWWLAGVLIVAVAVVVVAISRSGGGSHSAAPRSSHPPPPSSLPVGGQPAPLPSGNQPAVLDLGRPLLPGAAPGWDLFGRSADAVVRIQLATGQVTTTRVPALQSSGAVAFVAGPSSVIVRPHDIVPGYVVADGSAARPLAGLFAEITDVFPGPARDEVWVEGSSDQSVAPPPLVYDWTTNSVTAQRLVVLPAELGGPIAPDGSGYLLYTGVSGVYDVRSTGIRRVTTGAVIAVGTKSWLTLECDESFRCSTVLIDQRTGSRVRIGAATTPRADYLPGLISPDGRFAVYLGDAGSSAENLHVVDLTNFTDRTAAVRPSPDAFGTLPFVWAPSGHTLLMADSNGALDVVDPATLAAHVLDPRIPPVVQLTLRD